MSVEFRDIPNYDGYLAGSDGHIYSIKRKKFGMYKLKSKIYEGYVMVSVSVGGKEVSRFAHRLVAMAFHYNPENLPEVNHINAIKDDNRPVNLEWCTGEHNIKHALENGLLNSMKIKFSEEQIAMIMDVERYRIADLANLFSVCVETIRSFRKRAGVYKRESGGLLNALKQHHCNEHGCDARHHSHGYCRKHYYRNIQIKFYEENEGSGNEARKYGWIAKRINGTRKLSKG